MGTLLAKSTVGRPFRSDASNRPKVPSMLTRHAKSRSISQLPKSSEARWISTVGECCEQCIESTGIEQVAALEASVRSRGAGRLPREGG